MMWYVYGAGGLGTETMDIILDCYIGTKREVCSVAYLVDKPNKRYIGEIPVIAWADCQDDAFITVAVGEPEIRGELALKCINRGLTLRSVISDRAFVSKSADIQLGAVVAPFASIQANARISQNVAVNTQAIIGHDVFIDSDCVISSQANLGGAVELGARTYIGMGALVKENVTIGAQSIIGMGSVVYKNIPDNVIAIGNPARPAKRNESKRVFN